MKMSRARWITSVWNIVEDEFPDKSTEFLLSLTADVCKCDVGEVTEALIATEEFVPVDKHAP